MRGISFLAISVLAFAVAGPASGADDKPKDAAPKKEKLVCKQEADLGSHIAKRTCKTREEWRKEAEATAADSRRFMDKIGEQGSAAGAARVGAGN
jgi:hypothetical protein